MATTKKEDDISAPIAILVLFFAFALAAGGGLGGGGGGEGGDRGSQSASEDPCDGQDRDHVVKTWFTAHGIVRLRCGDEDSMGYRHLRRKGIGGWDDAMDCIGRALGEGTYRRGKPGVSSRTVRDQWSLRLAGQRNPTKVLVDVDTGNLLTVLVNTSSWTKCAEGALR
ncbi:MAG: hypothetical protein GEV03_05495 [Streptosporangiales bacterium]|nr:hypothetical protein [Streptosporangiales bacterium]